MASMQEKVYNPSFCARTIMKIILLFTLSNGIKVIARNRILIK